jgi:hypothetical protein
VRALLAKCGKIELEVYCATQSEISSRFRLGETERGAFQPTFENEFFQTSPCRGTL